MKKTIEFLKEQVSQAEDRFYAEVMNLDNHMNKCDCADCEIYNFFRVQVGGYPVLCLNCGGYYKC